MGGRNAHVERQVEQREPQARQHHRQVRLEVAHFRLRAQRAEHEARADLRVGPAVVERALDDLHEQRERCGVDLVQESRRVQRAQTSFRVMQRGQQARNQRLEPTRSSAARPCRPLLRSRASREEFRQSHAQPPRRTVGQSPSSLTSSTAGSSKGTPIALMSTITTRVVCSAASSTDRVAHSLHQVIEQPHQVWLIHELEY